MQTNYINIAIVDDKAINRQTIKEKLAQHKHINILFEAVNGKDYLQKLSTSKPLPDLVLMDLEMPETNGIETIKAALAWHQHIKYIVVTVFEDNDKIFEAIKAGASGYLLKEDNAIQVVDAIDSVFENNGMPMSPAIARKIMNTFLNKNDKGRGKEKLLSDRELDVLKEVVSGKNHKAIADKLYLSPFTVRKHIANIYEKLHVNNKAEAINVAYKNNWI